MLLTKFNKTQDWKQNVLAIYRYMGKQKDFEFTGDSYG